jgi:hypothetical protein
MSIQFKYYLMGLWNGNLWEIFSLYAHGNLVILVIIWLDEEKIVAIMCKEGFQIICCWLV